MMQFDDNRMHFSLRYSHNITIDSNTLYIKSESISILYLTLKNLFKVYRFFKLLYTHTNFMLF